MAASLFEEKKEELPASECEISNFHALFQSDRSLADHLDAFDDACEGLHYISELKNIIKFKVILTVTTGAKARILACLFAKQKVDTAMWLLLEETNSRYFGVGEVAKCVSMLDASRKARQLRAKVKRLQDAGDKALAAATASKEPGAAAVIEKPGAGMLIGSELPPRSHSRDSRHSRERRGGRRVDGGFRDVRRGRGRRERGRRGRGRGGRGGRRGFSVPVSATTRARRRTLESKSTASIARLFKLRTEVTNLETEGIAAVDSRYAASVSLSGAKQRLLRKWVRSFDRRTLEYYLLNFPTDNWRVICNLIHTNPSDFRLQYFQCFVFGGELPVDSLVAKAKNVSADNVLALLKEYPSLCECYSYLRRKLLDFSPEKKRRDEAVESMAVLGFTKRQCQYALERSRWNAGFAADWLFENSVPDLDSVDAAEAGDGPLSAECKHLLASEMPLEDLLWWYEELHSAEAEMEALERLSTAVGSVESSKTGKTGAELMAAVPPRKTRGKRKEKKKKSIEDRPDFVSSIVGVHATDDKVSAMAVSSIPGDDAVVGTVATDDASEGRKTGPIFSEGSQRSNYGKLMERLLTFRQMGYKFADAMIPHIELRLDALKAAESEGLPALRCAVLGDASGSMEVAVRSASIIASLLSVALRADLTFFDEKPYSPRCGAPTTVASTMRVVETVHALGATNMAAALGKYYDARTRIDLFVLVSDEGENELHNGDSFATLFAKYRRTVNASAKLFLVSFLKVGEAGVVQRTLAAEGIGDFKVFRLAPVRPDTSKFDSLLGQIKLMLHCQSQKKERRKRKKQKSAAPKADSAEAPVVMLGVATLGSATAAVCVEPGQGAAFDLEAALREVSNYCGRELVANSLEIHGICLIVKSFL